MRFAAICWLMLLVPSMALSQVNRAPTQEQTDRARALFEQGLRSHEQHRWTDCAREFEQSFALVFSPTLLYNIGRCYEEAAVISHDRDHYRRAIASYVRYLREDPSVDREPIDVRIAALTSTLADLPPEQTQAVDPPVEVQTRPVLVREYTTYSVPPGPAELSTLAPPPDTSGFGWTYTLSLGGATAAVAIAALITGLTANADYNALAETCGQTAAGCDRSDVSRVDTLATTTTVLLGISAALLVSTGVAFFIEFADQNTAGPAVEAFGFQLTRSF